MSTVNGLDSILGQSLSGLNPQTGAGGSGGTGAAGGAGSATLVDLSSRGGGKRPLVNNFDKVELSRGVPESVEAALLEEADEIAGAVRESGKLSSANAKKLREDRVLAALVGMRLIQKNTGEAKPVWLGGIPQPTQEELMSAYRRLTQRLSEPGETENPLALNGMRVSMLDYFRDADFSQYAEDYFLAA